jgi:transposase
MSHLLCANHDQVLLFPPCVEDWVPRDHPARFVRDFVQALSLPELGIPIPQPRQGQAPYDPTLLLGLWLYGYLRRVRTSRKVEDACSQDIGFIWLAGNQHPDHNTLARFLKENRRVFKRLFKMLVKTAQRLELIGLVLHALDGTKMASACGTPGALHRDDVTKLMTTLDARIEAMLVETAQADEHPAESIALPSALCDAQARRAAIQQQLDSLNKHEANHLQETESDARMQKFSDGKTRFGYNCQAMRDEHSGLIVAEEVTNAVCDTNLLVPMLAETHANLGTTAELTAADGGYVSGTEIANAETKGYDVLLNLSGLAGNPQAGCYPKRAFQYEVDRDCYRCPQGQVLPFAHLKQKERKAGNEVYSVRVYKCTACKTCAKRSACTSSQSGRRVERSDQDDAIERQMARQASPECQALLKMRSQIIEPFFSFVKDSGGFRRFTQRGLTGAGVQWSLICTTHNLKTLAGMLQAGRFTWEQFRAAIREAIQEIRVTMPLSQAA